MSAWGRCPLLQRALPLYRQESHPVIYLTPGMHLLRLRADCHPYPQQARCRYTTLEEHLASHHRYITEWNPDKFIHEAAAIHPDVEAYIRRVMEEKKHPEQAYKSCQGILSFARRVGNTRLTNACRWATSYGLYNYPIIERILNNRQDEFPLEDSAGQETEMPSHENIRGKEYYQ